MEGSRRYKKAWAKHARKANEYHNDVQLSDLYNYLSSCRMMYKITNKVRNNYT